MAALMYLCFKSVYQIATNRLQLPLDKHLNAILSTCFLPLTSSKHVTESEMAGKRSLIPLSRTV